MRKRLIQTLRTLTLGTSAAEIAEAAAVLPLMFMILLGIFWFGQAFRIYGTLTHAAREGARAAAAPICSTCTTANDPSTNAFNAVQDVLKAAALDPNKLAQPPAGKIPSVCSCGSTTTSCTGGRRVPCDGAQNKICVQGVTHSRRGIDQDNIQLAAATNATTTGAGVCGISVSFQYPYPFFLPFTSLNMQIVNLQAQGEARVESQ
jgi:Flp pilus assembly protein TadG